MSKKEIALVLLLLLGIIYLVIWQNFSWALALVSVFCGAVACWLARRIHK